MARRCGEKARSPPSRGPPCSSPAPLDHSLGRRSSISAPENELQIAAFLDDHPDFQLDDLAAEMPNLALRSAAGSAPALPGGGSAVMTMPHRDDTAGFFIARLRRR